MSKLNVIDKVVSYFDPKAGASRARFRAIQEILNDSRRRYEAATVSRRTSGWVANSSSPNVEIARSLSRLRNRSRDLVRNNPYAARAIQAIAANTVGGGIVPQPKSKTTEAQWRTWGQSTKCDADEAHSFSGIQNLAMREIAEAGEVLIRRRSRKSERDDLPLPLQLQVLEGDFLDESKSDDLKGGGFIRQGIEFDTDGRRVAYHLFRQHPGDAGIIGFGKDTIRVPAEDIIHIYRADRAGQIRGVPWGASVLLKLKDFDEYEDAQLVRQKIAACYTAFVYESEAETDLISEESGLDEKVEPASIVELPPGKKVEFGSPPTVGADYEPYASVTLRAVASGYGIPYEALTQDYSKVNFSSGRMGHLEFQRNIDQWRKLMLIPMLCVPVWSWFAEALELKRLAKSDRIKPPTWTSPAREMIDPTKEVPAQIKAVRGGIKSLSEVIREQGKDPTDHFEELKSDNEIIDKNRLTLDSDPRKINSSGTTQSGNGLGDPGDENENS